MREGEKVTWRSVNGMVTGIIVRPFDEKSWIVSLTNGKYAIVHEGSIKVGGYY